MLKKILLLSDTPLPCAIHGQHSLVENSGYRSFKEWNDHRIKLELLAQKIFQKYKIIDSNKQFIEQVNDILFWQAIDEINENHPTEGASAVHGGGSILEWVLLAKIEGRKNTSITLHEPRFNIALYAGEEKLQGVSRGWFTAENIDILNSQIEAYQTLYEVNIFINIEHENFHGLTEGSIAILDENRERTLSIEDIQKHRNTYLSKAPLHTISSHWLTKTPQSTSLKDIGFFDGSVENIKQIIEGHNHNLYSMVLHYLHALTQQVEREGSTGNVVGHPAIFVNKTREYLVKYHSEEQALSSLVDIFHDTQIQHAYFTLFDIVVLKKMYVEINFAKANGKDFIGYEDWILPIIKQYQDEKPGTLKICIGTDTHSLLQHKTLLKYWDNIRSKLILSGIREIYG